MRASSSVLRFPRPHLPRNHGAASCPQSVPSRPASSLRASARSPARRCASSSRSDTLEGDHMVALADQLRQAWMPLEVSEQIHPALLNLLLDTKGPRAISAGPLYVVLHRLEVPAVLVLRFGELTDPLGTRPVEDEGHLLVLVLELPDGGQGVGHPSQSFFGLRVRKEYYRGSGHDFPFLSLALVYHFYIPTFVYDYPVGPGRGRGQGRLTATAADQRSTPWSAA